MAMPLQNNDRECVNLSYSRLDFISVLYILFTTACDSDGVMFVNLITFVEIFSTFR